MYQQHPVIHFFIKLLAFTGYIGTSSVKHSIHYPMYLGFRLLHNKLLQLFSIQSPHPISAILFSRENRGVLKVPYKFTTHPSSGPPHLHSTLFIHSLTVPLLLLHQSHTTWYYQEFHISACMTRILRFPLWQYVTPANWFDFVFTRMARRGVKFPLISVPYRQPHHRRRES